MIISYHHAGGYHYAYVAYLGVIVAVEADEIALFELVYIAYLLPVVNLREFNDIFQRTVVVMKAKHMSLGGEEILRLRIYEKLQNLVSAGGLMKKGREYTALPKLISLKSETFPDIRL